MNYRQLANQLPANVRKTILEENLISKARQAGDGMTEKLFIYWRNYMEPGRELDLSCSTCVSGVLENWRRLQSSLIELEKDSKLLNSL